MALPKVDIVASANNYGRFKIEPLEQGYGTTLGNALRRVLLASLPGAAITSVRIDGVFHEFAAIPHVKEDVTEVVLNLKKVRLRSFSDRAIRMQLQASGEGVVRAGDIDYPDSIELVNPELVLATLDSPEARFDVELTVERGRGYVPAELRENMPIGVIPVDSIFTPITKVNYVVEHTRIGQITTYDRLVIEIWTDGSIDPSEALSEAADILVQQSSIIANFNKSLAEQDEKQPLSSVPVPSQVAEVPIEDLDLSVRTYNCLKRSGITKVGQILRMDEKDLLSVRNFGRKSLDELRARLISRGLMPGVIEPGAMDYGDEDEDELEDEIEDEGEDTVGAATGLDEASQPEASGEFEE